MIIFSLDGTLADCEHRRRFVDPEKNIVSYPGRLYVCRDDWKPDWKAFSESCDKDLPILPVSFQMSAIIKIFGLQCIQIWSGRSESVRNKTEEWLCKNLSLYGYCLPVLKMRPIGDNTPDEQLKEKWLDEHMQINRKMHIYLGGCDYYSEENPIEFVFDSDPKSIEMYRRRGIFVFDVNQNPGKEF